MNDIESILEKIDRLGNLEKLIITTLLVGGVIGLALLAPGIFTALGKISKKREDDLKSNIYFRTLPRLQEKGIIEYCNEGDKKSVRLTEYGKQLGNIFSLDLIHKVKQKESKKQIYTIISFDISESEKNKRNIFRNFLKEINCKYFYQSFWIYEGDIREEIKEIRNRLGIDDSIFACLAHESTFLRIEQRTYLSHGRGLNKSLF